MAVSFEDLGIKTNNDKAKVLAKTLTENEKKIVDELNAVQGKPGDIGGYYMPEPKKLEAVMRPSATPNAAFASVK